MRILVLAGGGSNEREVSLRSGSAVSAALTQAGHQASLFDPAAAPLTADLAKQFDVAFPALHGRGGEDGTVQGQLETIGLKYVGSDPAASRLCFDKWEYRQLVNAYKLPTAQGALVQVDNYRANALAQAPYVLKPTNGGSSIDTYIVRNPASPPEAQIADTFRRYPTMLQEQLIIGTELTVGVLGDTALPVIEIIPPSDGEFDYENKYNGASQELCPPENVTPDMQLAAQAMALKAHKVTGCRDFSRTDIMLAPTGEMYLLETNTIPGMTEQSLFPKMAATAGIAMSDLCDRLVQMAAKRA